MHRRAIRAFATLFVMAAVTHSAAADPIFNATDLGAIIATGLNNSGQVVGEGAIAPSGAPSSFAGGGLLYDGYGANAGTTFVFGSQYLPSAINDAGVMVGSAAINNSGAWSYGTVGGNVTPIQNDSPYIGAISQINAAGQVVYTEEGPAVDSFHAVIYNQNGSQMSIPLPSGQTLMTASAINNTGQVVGWTGTEATATAVLFSGGVVKSLGTLPGDTASMAYGINNSGQVVGVSHIQTPFNYGPFQGFLYSNGTMQSLGTLGGNSSVPQGINSSGEIYGYSTTADGSTHAFLDINGKMIDLTNLLHSLTGSISQYSYYNVIGINDNGQVLVQALNSSGDFNAYLLTPSGLAVPTAPGSSYGSVPVDVGPYTPPPPPIPEPPAAAVFALVVVGLGADRWLRRIAKGSKKVSGTFLPKGS